MVQSRESLCPVIETDRLAGVYLAGKRPEDDGRNSCAVMGQMGSHKAGPNLAFSGQREGRELPPIGKSETCPALRSAKPCALDNDAADLEKRIIGPSGGMMRPQGDPPLTIGLGEDVGGGVVARVQYVNLGGPS
jgi:hypothetical protein